MQKAYNARYLEYVSKISPKTNEKRSLLRAFFVGGTICFIGQFIRFFLESYLLQNLYNRQIHRSDTEASILIRGNKDILYSPAV